MRTTTIGILGVSAIAFAGCGSSKTFANDPRPATPINLTVYINNARVSVSPQAVGAGPVVFIVTNQAARAESLAIQRKGGGGSIANTGPINPQGTAQVTVNLGTRRLHGRDDLDRRHRGCARGGQPDPFGDAGHRPPAAERLRPAPAALASSLQP